MVSERAERTHRRSAAAFSVVLPAVVLTAVMVVAVGGAAAKPTPPIAASSNLCKGKTFKIGYDVFSSTQPFANLVTKGLKDAAKKTGCVTVITTVDNLNGPVAVGNVKTMLNEGANGIIDFNVLAAYQPAIAKLVKEAGVPADAIVGANLPGYPAIGADNYGASVINGQELAKAGKKKFGSTIPYVVVAAEPSAGPIVMQRYYGAVAGAKKVYTSLAERPRHPGDERRDRGRHLQQRRVGVLTYPLGSSGPHDGRQRRGRPRHVQGGAGQEAQLPRQLVRR